MPRGYQGEGAGVSYGESLISVKGKGGMRHRRVVNDVPLSSDKLRFEGQTVSVKDAAKHSEKLIKPGTIVFRWINGRVVPIRVKAMPK